MIDVCMRRCVCLRGFPLTDWSDLLVEIVTEEGLVSPDLCIILSSVLGVLHTDVLYNIITADPSDEEILPYSEPKWMFTFGH